MTAVLRWAAHPVAPTIAIIGAALALVAVDLTRGVPGSLAWVVIALSAGYAISGSV